MAANSAATAPGFPLMHVARYDPTTGKTEDFGPVTDRYDQVYFHGSAYVDGTLFLAETDSGVATLWEVKVPSAVREIA